MTFGKLDIKPATRQYFPQFFIAGFECLQGNVCPAPCCQRARDIPREGFKGAWQFDLCCRAGFNLHRAS